MSSCLFLIQILDFFCQDLSSGHAYIHIHVADDAQGIADVDAGDDTRGEERIHATVGLRRIGHRQPGELPEGLHRADLEDGQVFLYVIKSRNS